MTTHQNENFNSLAQSSVHSKSSVSARLADHGKTDVRDQKTQPFGAVFGDKTNLFDANSPFLS